MVYPRRQGRRLLTLLATGGLLIGTLAYAGTAVAVHDEGVFQLDGNGTTAGEPNANIDNPQANVSGAHDWDQIYQDCLAANSGVNNPATTGCGNSTFPTSKASHATFVTDYTGAGDTILTGGSTKDINDIPSWLWNQTATTSVQGKDDIEHAFAAQYDIATGGTGQPVDCGSITAATADCKLLYFGADRFANDGNTTMGFWFFQHAVGAVAGGTFSGQHTARSALGHGDILVVADFPNSSAAPTVSIYEWVASGGNTSTHLDLIGGGASPADCTQGAAPKPNASPVPPVANGDNFCATVDANPTGNGVASPWPFTPKSNSSGTTGANVWGTGEFMEGGINMTALGLGSECVSTVLAETRSSNSPTSTLSDFTLGNFGGCGSSIKTTSGAATGNGTIGTGTVTSPTDSATVNVTGISTWSGGVDFYLCGPIATGACSSSGVKVSSGVAVSDSNKTVSSGTANLTSAGRYCWYAAFVPSAASAAAGVPGSTDDGSGTSPNPECFTVGPVQPTMTTQASADVAINTTALTDTATLMGTATQPGTNGGNATYPSINATNGAAAGGSITWTAYGPGSTACPTSPIAMAATSRTVSGDGTYPTALQTSVGFTPTSAGLYTFVASYNGSSPNTLSIGASSCTDTKEQAHAGSSSTVTTPEDGSGNPIPAGGLSIGTGTVTAMDHAVVTASGITPWSGTVQFSICGPLATGSCTSGGSAVGGTVAVSNTSNTADTPITVTFTEAGRYCWRADFVSSTTGIPNSSDGRTTECFTINPVQPALSTLASPHSLFVNNPVTDTATISGTATEPGSGGLGSDGSINPTTPGSPAGGSITWIAYGPNDCSTVEMASTSRTVSGDGTYPTATQASVGFTPTLLGTYTFVASYNGDSPNTKSIAASACPDTTGTEVVTVTGHARDSSAQQFLPNDVVTLSGDSTLTGTLTVTLYNDGTCGTTGGSPVTGQQYTFHPSGDPSGSMYPTSNTSFLIKVANAGNYSWKVVYSDTILTSPPDLCESSAVTIAAGQ
jgi:hypothetical protein